MHSLSDGSLYPWITTMPINMLRNKNGKYENIKNARQAAWFSRSTTYAMVTLHGKLIFQARTRRHYFIFDNYFSRKARILSATTHNKTGLIRYYGRWPILLLGFYLCTFAAAQFTLNFLDAYSTKKLAEKSEYIGLFVFLSKILIAFSNLI
uniref:7TM_GPCR_Srx domain-containing protein n=1 Tax=Elaeophora elaphi TaxID=1147741 RepID=A0A0R3RUS9_9BILA